MSLKLKNRLKISNLISVAFDKDDKAKPAEILIYEQIGRDFWTGEGITAKDFKSAIDAVEGREITLRINSYGGEVYDGMAIYNLIAQYPQKVTAVIDGIAASTASFIPMACDSVEMPKNAQMFIHDPWAMCVGNSEDMSKAGDMLDKAGNQIAGIYADKNGKSIEEMRQLMRDETMITGEDALKLGLVDKLIEKVAVKNFSEKDLQSMKSKLHAMRNQLAASAEPQNNPTNPMRKKLIAALNKLGIKFKDSATDEELAGLLEAYEAPTPAAAAPAADAGTGNVNITQIQNDLKALRDAAEFSRTEKITNAVQKAIDDDRIPSAQKESWVKRAKADETVLIDLAALPAKPPGTAPVPGSGVAIVSEAIEDVSNHILNCGPRFTAKFFGQRATHAGMLSVENGAKYSKGAIAIRDEALKVAHTYNKYRDKIITMWNTTNTIDSELQRTVILQEMLRAFKVVILQLNSFSVVYESVPLEGTDTIAVPYYPLQTAAARSWDPAVGYVADNTNTSVRDVVVGGSGVTSGSSAPANTAKDRKYLGLAYDSYTLARQPFFNAVQLLVMNAQKLAVDIFTDVVSRVITAANYGASALITPAAAFDSTNVADLKTIAEQAYWPAGTRTMSLDSTYHGNLLKDPAFKSYLNYGSTSVIQDAVITNAYGFNTINSLPLSQYSPAGENLQGWINYKFAMLVATANIMPAPAVRQLLARYDLVVDPDTGISFAAREFGTAATDVTGSFIECSYGAKKGVDAALKRITSA